MKYEVVHSIAGRLRIRILQLAWDVEFADQLTALVESMTYVTNVRLNQAARSLVICYEATRIESILLEEQLAGCIRKARVDKPVTPEAIADQHLYDHRDDQPEEEELEPEINHWRDLAMPCLSLGLALLAAPLELPVLLVTAGIAGAALPWFMRATDSLVNHRHPNIDLLDSLWMTLQTVQGQYTAPALKTCLVEVRRSLRGTMADDRQQQALNLLTWLEQESWVERDGQLQRIATHALQVGDRVRVHSGELIPVDGWILAGAGCIDESSLTGQSLPVVCSDGQAVYASTRLIDGELWILAERIGIHTRIGIVAHQLQAAPVHDTHIGVQQAEFVKAAIFPTIALGGGIFALTGNLGAAISPFQFDFGSGIPISVHSTLLLALTEAARHGIYIRSARILELLAQLDTVVFDQTGLAEQAEQNPEWHSELFWQERRWAIAALHQYRIASYWVTADPAAGSKETVRNLGIQAHQVWAEAAHEQASILVQALRHQGKTVAYVGTGETSPTLQPHIMITVAQAGEIPSATADVVLLDSDLQGLNHAIAIAKRAMEVVYQNTAIIVLPNLLMQIGGGMLLGMNPVINVITNNSSALVAEFIHGAKPLFDRPLSLPRRKRNSIVKSLPENNSTAVESWVVGLKQPDLAKRLGVTSQALTSQRSKPKFSQWAQTKDPEGRPWRYDATQQYFYAIEAT